jgi:uncharacterized integral membrane protein
MTWYEKALKEKRRETISGTIFAVTSALALLVWYFAFGKAFHITDFEPLSTPFEYVFYSALVFVGPGAYLRFNTKFYLKLKRAFKHDRQMHKDVKKVIWRSMMVGVLIVVIAVVYLINKIISFFYNLFGLILYLCPPLGIGLIAGAVSYVLINKDTIG